MKFDRELRRTLYTIGVPLVCLGLAAFWAFHLLEGDRGVRAWLALDRQIEVGDGYRRELKGEREKLEQRIALLRENAVDSDMLDEQLRGMLNLIKPGELVILYPKPLTAVPGKDKYGAPE